jgi:hypothetical protein
MTHPIAYHALIETKPSIIYAFFKDILDWMTAVQTTKAKAERMVANELWKTEYRHETFEYVLDMVQGGKYRA